MDRRTYEAILDNAMRSEIDARDFYLAVANRMQAQALKEMFLDLAAEELGHQRTLAGFRDNPTAAMSFDRVPDYHVAETVAEPALSLALKPADAFALAMKKEERAMKHYTELADACRDGQQRALFLELAAMERTHKARMEKAFVDIGYPEVW